MVRQLTPLDEDFLIAMLQSLKPVNINAQYVNDNVLISGPVIPF